MPAGLLGLAIELDLSTGKHVAATALGAVEQPPPRLKEEVPADRKLPWSCRQQADFLSIPQLCWPPRGQQDQGPLQLTLSRIGSIISTGENAFRKVLGYGCAGASIPKGALSSVMLRNKEQWVFVPEENRSTSALPKLFYIRATTPECNLHSVTRGPPLEIRFAPGLGHM